MDNDTNTVRQTREYGELLDEFETPRGTFQLFSMGSGVPPHGEDRPEVLRYDLIHEAQDDDAPALPYWGSVAQTMGEGEEPDAPAAVAAYAADIMHVWDACHEAATDLDELSVDDRHAFCDTFGRYCDQFGVSEDGDQLRAFLAGIEAARALAAVGIDRDDAADLYEHAEHEPRHELRA